MVVMALVTVIVTGLCLLLIRHRLRADIANDVAQALSHSVTNFSDLQDERLAALDRENALLADLPTLKALMTSGDDLTIQDGAVEFWDVSGNDLFALANAQGRIVAAYTRAPSSDTTLRAGLKALLAAPQNHYLIDSRALYACSLRPLYFGNDENGTLLGYVISGTSIERTLRQISQPTGVEAAFMSRGMVLAATLPVATQTDLSAHPPTGTARNPSSVQLGDAAYLVATEDLSKNATAPLQLVVLKSFAPAEQSIQRIDRMVLSVGAFALISGTLLMIVLARLLTRPLEELSRSVRAFGEGHRDLRVPRYGTQEVRELSASFSAMRDEIRQTHRALLESERLATIGRMASSISHDFRHYLAAIYANAEFLASGRLAAKESSDVFAEIRAAVLGTTDMIESLLIFSRTGTGMRRAPELMSNLIERAVSAMRAHPDSNGVTITTHYGDPSGTAVSVDGKQIERAIFNLLLNACQAARARNEVPKVSITLDVQEQHMFMNVLDNGVGVPETIRTSLFQPFVSEGKQKGTGLGLTLAHCIAEEHGGEVVLLSSRPGETIFQMRIAQRPASPAAVSPLHDQVVPHEKVRT